MLPFYLLEKRYSDPVAWNASLAGIFLYLGIGASVLSYFCWNLAIGHMGTARTALFGNLIPLFSIIEAIIILQEQISFTDILSGMLIITGLFMANIEGLRQQKPAVPVSTSA
jgi:drug/metabolite transporter (DMT)-like permease